MIVHDEVMQFDVMRFDVILCDMKLIGCDIMKCYVSVHVILCNCNVMDTHAW